MNYTAREDYGLRAVLDLAEHATLAPVQSKDIASRQGIPEQFLEQLLGALRRGGLVRSVRGASGGYHLARSASTISVGDVLRTLSGPLAPIPCLGEGGAERCEHGASYGVHVFWERLADAVSAVSDGMSVQDLVDFQQAHNDAAGYMMNI